MTADERPRVLAAFDALTGETRLLFHRLRATADEIHRERGIPAGQRALLFDLDEGGPRTVPQLARARPVSRQHVQMLVNPLLAAGWVELVDNPAHRRSKLVRLTSAGRGLVRSMRRRETAFLERLPLGLSARSLRSAARVLAEVREALAKRSGS